MNSTPNFFPLGLSLLCIAMAGCSTTESVVDRIEEIRHLNRRERFVDAARESGKLLRSLDDDSRFVAEVQELQRDISISSGLSSARQLSLNDNDRAALAILREVDQTHPGHQVVQNWILRTTKKVSRRWFDDARQAVGRGDYKAARVAYKKSLEFDPSRTVVNHLVAEIDRIEAYRDKTSTDYYFEGVNALQAGRLDEASQKFSASKKYNEDNERATERIEEAKVFRAKRHAERGGMLAKEEKFFAALSEYRKAAALTPDDEDMARNVVALQKECKTVNALGQAHSMILREQFDKADALLKEQLPETALQRKSIEKALETLEQARLQQRYDRALDLSHDFQFLKARDAFTAIQQDAGFYQDVQARLDAIEETITLSEKLYGEAAAATGSF